MFVSLLIHKVYKKWEFPSSMCLGVQYIYRTIIQLQGENTLLWESTSCSHGMGQANFLLLLIYLIRNVSFQIDILISYKLIK